MEEYYMNRGEEEEEGFLGYEEEEEGFVGDEDEEEGFVGDEDEEEGFVGDEDEEEGFVGDEDEEEGFVGDEDEEEGFVGDEDEEEGFVGDEDDEEGFEEEEKPTAWSSWEKYTTLVLNSISGKETFVDKDGEIYEPNPYVPHATVYTGYYSIVALISAIGVAYLSFCYNKYIGSTDIEQILWPVVSFFFSGFYKIFYAMGLNPLCKIKKQ
jgi:hypothetical protein